MNPAYNHTRSDSPQTPRALCQSHKIDIPEAEELVRDALRVASIVYRRIRRKRTPFWSEVSRMFSHGSGYSAAICIHYGYDPDTGEEL